MALIKAIIDTSTSPQRIVGWTRAQYSNDSTDEEPVDYAEEEIKAAFERARDASHSLAGVDEPIDAAVAEPLEFADYLIVESDGSLAFNPDYSRGADGSQSSP
jgi:hypothetical protein